MTQIETSINKTDKINEAGERRAQDQDEYNKEIKKVNASNSENITAYINTKVTEDIKKIEKATNKLDDGMDDIEVIKSQKVTKFSDENQNYLASQFPEGITEKTFQRKDNDGNVIEVTTIRILVVGNKGAEYKKVASRWATNYFKNGRIISAQVWDTDTH